MRRIGIYLTYDRQKVIDRYIGYLLKELRTCVDYLIVVCNEEEIARGAEILEEHADQIFFRKNIGFDAGGFKDALCSFLGWEQVLQYDELVLANDSMYGPFIPMKDIFARMEGRRADFWGLAIHGRGINDYIGEVQEHVQSYFIVVRERLLHSCEFRDYWERLPYFKSFRDTILRHEIGFTRYFADLGYTYDALADTKANDSEHYWNNYSQYALIPFEMIEKRNFPFFKKQPLSSRTLFCQTQENFRQAIDYIDRETEYDSDLMWENMIRTLDMADMQSALHLRYLLSGERMQPSQGSAAVIVFISYPDSVEYVVEYLRRLPEDFSVCLSALDTVLLEPYRAQGIHCREAEPERRAELLWEFREFDYVCVIHDTDMTSENNYSCEGKSYFYSVWGNLLKSGEYVREVTACFARERYLGFLAPPQPNFGKYLGEYGKGWDEKYQEVHRAAEELGLCCQMSEGKAPYRVTDNFWVRGRILGKLKGMRREDVSLLPYLWSYLAQDEGCYSGIVEDVAYAAMDAGNLQYYLEGLTAMVRQKCGEFTDYIGMKERIRISALRAFCGKYRRIYVYGAGEEARARKSLLPHIDSYIVSDGEAHPREIDGVEVRCLSEVDLGEDCGVVVLLNGANQAQVTPLLEARGFRDYFCI